MKNAMINSISSHRISPPAISVLKTLPDMEKPMP
jgi:hypothetical protein